MQSDLFRTDASLRAAGMTFELHVRNPLRCVVHADDGNAALDRRTDLPREWLIYLERKTLDDEWTLSAENDEPAVFAARMGSFHQTPFLQHPPFIAQFLPVADERLREIEDLVRSIGVSRLHERIGELESMCERQIGLSEANAIRRATNTKPLTRHVEGAIFTKVVETPVGPIHVHVSEGPQILFSSFADLPLLTEGPDVKPLRALWRDSWISKPENKEVSGHLEAARVALFADHPDVIEAAREAQERLRERAVEENRRANEIFRATIANRCSRERDLIDLVEASLTGGMRP